MKVDVPAGMKLRAVLTRADGSEHVVVDEAPSDMSCYAETFAELVAARARRVALDAWSRASGSADLVVDIPLVLRINVGRVVRIHELGRAAARAGGELASAIGDYDVVKEIER